MKIKNLICAFAFITLVSMVYGCRKNTNTAPTIDIAISSPIDQAVFRTGDTVHINAAVTSPVDMHGYTWEIQHKANGAVLASAADHAHGQSFTVSDTWIDTVSVSTEVVLVFTAEIDHEGHTASKTITFSCQP